MSCRFAFLAETDSMKILGIKKPNPKTKGKLQVDGLSTLLLVLSLFAYGCMNLGS
jgi:hypothetical protein